MDSTVVETESTVKFGRRARIGAILTLVLIGGFFVAQKFYTDYRLKQTEPYRQSTQKLLSQPRVKEMMGEPISVARFVSGNVDDSGMSGSAFIEIPINGSKRKGTIYTFATKHFEEWHYDFVAVMAPQCGPLRKRYDADDMFAMAVDINNGSAVEALVGGMVLAGNSGISINGRSISGAEGTTTVIDDSGKTVYTGEQLSRLVFDVALANYPTSDVLNREDGCR